MIDMPSTNRRRGSIDVRREERRCSRNHRNAKSLAPDQRPNMI